MNEALFDSVAEFYDAEIENLIKFKNDIPFYLEYANECGGEVLELACGTGRVLVPLAQHGITITGLDASQGMLDQARRKVAALPPEARKRVNLAQQDMKSFRFERRFSLIFCAFRSFQHLVSRKDQGACLALVREHLDDEGIFILHLFVPFHHLLAQMQRSLYSGMFRDQGTGAIISRRSEISYDLARQTLHEDRYYEWTDQHGKFHRHIWSFGFAFIFRHEAELLLEKHGFKVVDVYGDFDRRSFNYYSGEQIFVVEKTPGGGWS